MNLFLTLKPNMAHSFKRLVLLFTTSFLFFTSHSQSITGLSTNKALYNPGEVVTFKASTSTSVANQFLRVRYYHLSVQLSTRDIAFSGTSATWTWTAPSTDHQGYLVSVELRNASGQLNQSAIGVNVSTSHSRFPVYGFLSKFPSKTDWEMDVQMEKLNRYHINWIQFYDWMDTHHDPLAGTASSPSTQWEDLARRPTYFETVKGYIDRGHNNYNMKSMQYGLVYGVYANEWFDPSWHLYNSDRWTIWNHPLPSAWEASALNMMDLNNANWRNYFLGKINEVYNATNLYFDGWQMDQLGDFGYKYTNTGAQVDVAQSFPGFIQAAKNAAPAKTLVFNAVNTYAQSLVANAPVDFLYTEMWTGNEDYASIRRVIETNESYNASKKNVFAAYVGKGRSGSPGVHSHGAVILCDATMFALGGAHIEMGEHLLCNEYFPNNNLSMSANLEKELIAYYDFLVAYENILRDGRTFNGVTLSGTGCRYWPPVKGQIATVGVSWKGNQVFHCLNYSNVNTLGWRDDQPEPAVKTNIPMSFPYSTTVRRMWVASPDVNNGVPQSISFTQSGGVVRFNLPSIKYWTMIVAETGSTAAAGVTDAGMSEYAALEGVVVEQPMPNPSKGETSLTFTLASKEWVRLDLVDVNGNYRKTIANKEFAAGTHNVAISLHDRSAGVHLVKLVTKRGTTTVKVVKVE
jgi:dextranase